MLPRHNPCFSPQVRPTNQANQHTSFGRNVDNSDIIGARTPSSNDPHLLLGHSGHGHSSLASSQQRSAFLASYLSNPAGGDPSRRVLGSSTAQPSPLNPNAQEWYPQQVSVGRLPSPPEELIPYSDHYEDDFGATALIREDGALEFNIEARFPTSPKGSEIFKKMMDNIGENVVAIRGNWCSDDSSNWVSFEKNLSTGVSPEEAAANTWTGKMAIRSGYTKITIETPIEGKSVGVLFTIPENKWPPGQAPEICEGNSRHVDMPYI